MSGVLVIWLWWEWILTRLPLQHECIDVGMSCSLPAKFLAFSCFICIFWRLLPTWESPVRSLQGKAELYSHTHLMLTVLSCPTRIRRNPWESLSSGSCFCLGWLLQRQAGLTHLPSMQPHNASFEEGNSLVSVKWPWICGQQVLL